MDREKILSNFILFFVFSLIISYFIFLQFISPVLYEVDGYYHVAVSKFIKTLGLNYQFHWTQFSTFKDFFSDSDLIFHLLIIPFLFFTDNIVLAGKYGVVFYNILFLLAYIFILKKYLSNRLVSCFMLLPMLSSAFVFYSLLLRGTILAHIFIILGIYFLIEKKWRSLFVVSFLYSLSHLSFFMMIIFALLCEIIRYTVKKEFITRNIIIVFLGIIMGAVVHPNFPNNILSFYLNSILVPILSFTNPILSFGTEVYSSSAKFIFINNFAVFLTFNVVLWVGFLKVNRVTFPTFVWCSCASIYFLLSFFSDRFWFTTNVLVFIFFASYLHDWIQSKGQDVRYNKINTAIIILCLCIIILFSPANVKTLKKSINDYAFINSHYEKVASWMKNNLPAGETIYHANGSDAPYFICLNPKDDYIFSNDPIYMFYLYPHQYEIYKMLREGKIANPSDVLRKVFHIRYGYTRTKNPLFYQIKNDQAHFKALYEDQLGMIFEII